MKTQIVMNIMNVLDEKIADEKLSDSYPGCTLSFVFLTLHSILH